MSHSDDAPKKTTEPTAVGACRFTPAVHARVGASLLFYPIPHQISITINA